MSTVSVSFAYKSASVSLSVKLVLVWAQLSCVRSGEEHGQLKCIQHVEEGREKLYRVLHVIKARKVPLQSPCSIINNNHHKI